MATAALKRVEESPGTVTPSRAGDLPPGTCVDGRFTVLEPIGRGGSSVVYLAEQRSMGRKVALKVLKPDLATDEQARCRFQREIRAVSALTDPHTISVFDVGATSEGLLYIAMELLRGRSLADVLQTEGGRLGTERAVAIAGQILDSLTEAHQAGIIHGDLKPENVFLLDRGETDFVKVLDFGIATFLDEAAGATDSRQVVGTIQYMSPEQVLGRPVDARTDLYSLAVLLFEMVSGRLPFDGPTAVDLAVRKVRDPVPSARVFAPRSRITAELDTFLVRALSANPADRPSHARAFREAMTHALQTTRESSNPAVPEPLPAPSAHSTGPGPATILPFRCCHSTATPRNDAMESGGNALPPPVKTQPESAPFPVPRPPEQVPGDRRLTRRERRVRSVSFLAQDRWIKGVMTDISPSGMFVATACLPPVGTRTDFLIADPSSSGQFRGLNGTIVRHVAQPASPGEVRGFGVRFNFGPGSRLPLTVAELFGRAAIVIQDEHRIL